MGGDHAWILHGYVSGAEVELVADVDLERARTVDAVVIASHDLTHDCSSGPPSRPATRPVREAADPDARRVHRPGPGRRRAGRPGADGLHAAVRPRVRAVIATSGEWFADDHRMMRPALAGGPLLDLSTYPLALAQWVLDAPIEVVARCIDPPSKRQALMTTRRWSRSSAMAYLTPSRP